MQIQTNAPRNIRSFVRSKVASGAAPLKLLSPKQTGESGWRYAAVYFGKLICLSRPMLTRDAARADAERRFGVKASEYRVSKPKRKLAA
jgi:hypothetical protein